MTQLFSWSLTYQEKTKGGRSGSHSVPGREHGSTSYLPSAVKEEGLSPSGESGDLLSLV